LEISVDEVSLVVVPVLEVEDALSPNLAASPISLKGVPVTVVHSSVTFLIAFGEAALVAITVVRNEDAFALEFVHLPLAVID
jgi:hypothetical protein